MKSPAIQILDTTRTMNEHSFDVSAKSAEREYNKAMAILQNDKDLAALAYPILENSEARIHKLLADNKLAITSIQATRPTGRGLYMTGYLKLVGRGPWQSENKNYTLKCNIEDDSRNVFDGKIVIQVNQYSLTKKDDILFDMYVIAM